MTEEEKRERNREKQRVWYADAANKEKKRVYNSEYHRENRPRSACRNALYRAKQVGLPFDLDHTKLHWPHFCPLCGEEMDGSALPRRPSLDRIKPELGYTMRNVIVICMGCNTTKGNKTLDELRRIIQFYDKLISDRGL